MSTNNRRRLLSAIELGVLFTVLALGPSSASAEYWGVSAITATPEFLPKEDVHSFNVVSTDYGRGVTTKTIPGTGPALERKSTAKLYVPVTAALGTQFDMIWLRAIDNMGTGAVKASFYRQELASPLSRTHRPVLLGSVETQTSTGSGFQFVTGQLRSHLVDHNRNVVPLVISRGFTYYIEIEISMGLEVSKADSPPPKVVALDVGFDLDPCNVQHPDFGDHCV